MKRIAITGGTGRLGSLIADELRNRGDEVTVLSRSKGDVRWDPMAGPAPTDALAGRDAVVHLAGEYLLQRWNDAALRRIRESREIGTRNLVAGMREAEPRPAALISAAGTGYYGHRPDPIDEDALPGDDVLAEVCKAWEREAANAEDLGVRVVRLRTGVVLDRQAGALKTMLLPFRLGVGGPVAGGRQPMPWIHLDDVIGMYLAAIDDDRWTGPVHATAPDPLPNREFSKALGRALHRPAIVPVPAFALKILYGGMSKLVIEGQNAVPRRATQLGYRYKHPDLDEALRSALTTT